jgi:hypothetical protein
MNMIIDVNDKNRIVLEEWGLDGSQDMRIQVKAMDQFQSTGGVLLSKERAAALAISLLNRAGMSHMLAAKYRWKD